MEFKNVNNEKVELKDGRVTWLSRSVAVVGTVVIIKGGNAYLLIGKRGKGSADFQGMWNLPCGYLDYDETTGEATVREVWEECGVNLTDLQNHAKINMLEKPWDTYSNPKENRQNVVFHHGLIAKVDYFPTTSTANCEPDEVEEVQWIPLDKYEDFEYCFNHKNRIKQFIDKYGEYIENVCWNVPMRE